MNLIQKVAAWYLQAALFNVGDIILFGKYKNKKGRILEFGSDHKGNPTVTIEPIPKGRKQNKTFGLYKIWHAPEKDALTEKVAAAYLNANRSDGQPAL